MSSRFKLAALAFCLLLSSVFPDHAQAADSAALFPQNTPQSTLNEFYRWYLDALMKQRVPLEDDHVKMATFVGRTLLRTLDRRLKSDEGFGEDYFTRAQDYFDDWLSNITVSNMRAGRKTASATVALGASRESRHRLALQLVREDGGWKISRVGAPSIERAVKRK